MCHACISTYCRNHDSKMWLHEITIQACLHNAGDAGYSVQPWLMTPIRAPKDEPEEEYEALTKTRQVIERTFGLLKSRFRCLDKSGGVLQYKPQICCRITVACIVLHNYCMRHHVSLNEPLGNIIGLFHNLSAPGGKAVYLGFQ